MTPTQKRSCNVGKVLHDVAVLHAPVTRTAHLVVNHRIGCRIRDWLETNGWAQYREGGIVELCKQHGKKLPLSTSSLQACIRLANKLTESEVRFFEREGVSWRRVRRVLAALPGYQRTDDDPKRVSRIKNRLRRHGTKGFDDYVTSLCPPRK